MVDLPEGIEPVRNKLNVLTWNVWFDDYEFDTRTCAIFKICEELDPDVICFQEVLQKFLDKLTLEKWVTLFDCSSDFLENTVDPYGVVVLVKKKFNPTFEVHMLNTVMDRKLVCANLSNDGANLYIGTIHLESLKFKDIRRDQLMTIGSILQRHENNILCGDFNFCSYRNFIEGGELENNCLQEILPEHVDMWQAFYDTTENKGYTYDSELNPMITHDEQMRYDRILYKFTNKGELSPCWWPQTIRMVGMEAIRQIRSSLSTKGKLSPTPPASQSPLRVSADDVTAVLPSDHFGLYACFELHSYERVDEKKSKKCCIS